MNIGNEWGGRRAPGGSRGSKTEKLIRRLAEGGGGGACGGAAAQFSQNFGLAAAAAL
jgi:hypothetical protein